MVGNGVELKILSNGSCVIRFRIQDLREYLIRKKHSRSGKQIRKSLEILERSTVEVEYGTKDNKITMTGTYLQSASKIDSKNPIFNGLYEATLHPHFSKDIREGRFRFIEDKYLTPEGKSPYLVQKIVHHLRHKYTQAPASKDNKSAFEFSLSDAYFSTGLYINPAQPTSRKLIGEIRSELKRRGIIDSDEDFTYTVFYDPEVDINDFKCRIVTSQEWGESQKRDNGRQKHITKTLEKIKSEDKNLIE